MPGISYKNIHGVMNRKMNFKELLNQQASALEKMLDSKRDADCFVAAFNFNGTGKITKNVSTSSGSNKFSRYKNIV